MLDNAYAVIMAGGRGERFWPLSTSRTPKQLLSLFGGKPLVRVAAERLTGLIPPDRILIITGSDIAGATARAVPFIPRANVIAEPFGRDTAAAVALAAAVVRSRQPDGVFAVLTADHIIAKPGVFLKILGASLRMAGSSDSLITIGITPAFPSTGFGYIEAGSSTGRGRGTAALFRKALRFVEKPDLQTAEKYVKSGRYFWNSGMFIWSVSAIRNALRQHVPHLCDMSERLEKSAGTSRFAAVLKREYSRLDKISIDYAVMEKARNILMIPGDFGWDDVGSWAAVGNHFNEDASGNAVVGALEVLDSRGNTVVSQDRLTALIGVNDTVVIHAAGATLVCARERAQDVKKMVDILKKKGVYANLL